jgi:hypothetical protein
MKRLSRHAVRLLPALLALGLVLYVLRSADAGRALGLVWALGWRLPLLLIPNLMAVTLEAAGWWLSFSRLSGRPGFASLVGVRLMGDSLMLALPSGAVVSESLQPYLLKRRCHVPFETGIVAGFARKFFVILSHGLFLALATLLAWPLLNRVSRATIGRGGLPWLLLGTAAVLATVAIAGVVLGVQGRIADRLRRGLDRVGGRWLGSWLERNALRFRRADEHLASFFSREPLGLLPPLLLYMLGWFTRAAETLLFLRLVGVAAPLSAAMTMESALILVRAMAVPVPAGLGIQDLGYVLSLKALGVGDAATVGAAFVLLKRGRDLFWVFFGFALLLLGGRREEPALATASIPGAA